MPRFRLDITAKTGRQHAAFLRRNLAKAHAVLRPPLRELSLVIVGDAAMARLHQNFLNKPGPTDVLTFPLEFDARNRPIAGEVVVCLPEARRQARKLGTTAAQELLVYALHGMLHLSGLDDRTDRQYQIMHRMEDTILRRIGVGAVFSRKGCS